MRVIDLNSLTPEIEALLRAAEQEDVVLRQNGHNVARIERFTDEDMDDWLFEHDPKVIREARASYERVKKGGGISLEDLRRELGV